MCLLVEAQIWGVVAWHSNTSSLFPCFWVPGHDWNIAVALSSMSLCYFSQTWLCVWSGCHTHLLKRKFCCVYSNGSRTIRGSLFLLYLLNVLAAILSKLSCLVFKESFFIIFNSGFSFTKWYRSVLLIWSVATVTASIYLFLICQELLWAPRMYYAVYHHSCPIKQLLVLIFLLW